MRALARIPDEARESPDVVRFATMAERTIGVGWCDVTGAAQ